MLDFRRLQLTVNGPDVSQWFFLLHCSSFVLLFSWRVRLGSELTYSVFRIALPSSIVAFLNLLCFFYLFFIQLKHYILSYSFSKSALRGCESCDDGGWKICVFTFLSYYFLFIKCKGYVSLWVWMSAFVCVHDACLWVWQVEACYISCVGITIYYIINEWMTCIIQRRGVYKINTKK